MRQLVRPTVGLVLVFAATCGLALWQASNHLSPTIFTDELEMTQLARSLADTGHATLRGQAPNSVPLAAYLSAPLWWIDDVPMAYALIKALGACLMAATIFPAYALARLVVRPVWALFAAAGTGLSPALAYAPILVKEPTAYPAATLALFLIVRWVAAPSKRGFAIAVASCVLGYVAKDQLAVLLVILGLSTLALIWRSDSMSSFRQRWTRGDWVGSMVLGIGAIILAGAWVTKRSEAWYISTTFFQDRMLEYGLWAFGALAIGLGIVPLVAGLASLARPKHEEPQPGVQAFVTVTIASCLSFGYYTAIKAAYLSTVFATLTLERNLIFLAPLLFAGTALFLQRRGGRWWALVAAACIALYLVRSTPYSLTQYPNYEAHGLAIAALANRIFRWPAETIEYALIAVTISGTVVLALLPRLRGRVAVVATSCVAAFSLGWAGTTEVYAAHGESLFSKRLYETLPQPPNWLDRSTDGQSVVFLGQGIRDPNPVNLLEFWNRSLTKIWALDGSAPGPGATGTPNLDRIDGTLTDPQTAFVLASPGVDVVGTRRGEPVGGYSLYPLSGMLRLRTATSGIYPDGWMGESANYALYDVPAGVRGQVHIALSRESWCGKDIRSTITARVGPVGINETSQPSIRTVTAETSTIIHSCQLKELSLPTPPVPWRVEITVRPTFSPARIDPALGDARELGAVVRFTSEVDP